MDERSDRRMKGAFPLLLLATAASILIGWLGWTIWVQLRETQTAVQELTTRLADIEEIAASATVRSERAAELAAAAADGRVRAESAQMQAESERDEALLEALEMSRRAATAQEELEQIQEARRQELNRLHDALGRIVETRRTAIGLVMNLGSDAIQFDFDQAALKPENRELLSRIAGILMTAEGYRIQVGGHTDDVGTEEYNQRLSERRAQAVHDYLIEAGISPDIITTKGYGKTNPLVEGTDSTSRARNRRVEIGIIDTVVNYEKVLIGNEATVQAPE
jgi:outer membrane protein OmpA-like peptidoglycan-associated protein